MQIGYQFLFQKVRQVLLLLKLLKRGMKQKSQRSRKKTQTKQNKRIESDFGLTVLLSQADVATN
jgi:hypothetical protein